MNPGSSGHLTGRLDTGAQGAMPPQRNFSSGAAAMDRPKRKLQNHTGESKSPTPPLPRCVVAAIIYLPGS